MENAKLVFVNYLKSGQLNAVDDAEHCNTKQRVKILLGFRRCRV